MSFGLLLQMKRIIVNGYHLWMESKNSWWYLARGNKWVKIIFCQWNSNLEMYHQVNSHLYINKLGNDKQFTVKIWKRIGFNFIFYEQRIN